MVWLIFAALVVLRVDEERASAQFAREASDATQEIRPMVIQPLEETSDVSEATTDVGATDTTERMSEASLERATDEPLVDELTAFFQHIQNDLGRADARIPAELNTYVSELVARINAGGELFVVRLYDPSLEVARRQAVRGHALLVEAGLQLWLLETYGERGSATVSVSRG